MKFKIYGPRWLIAWAALLVASAASAQVNVFMSREHPTVEYKASFTSSHAVDTISGEMRTCPNMEVIWQRGDQGAASLYQSYSGDPDPKNNGTLVTSLTTTTTAPETLSIGQQALYWVVDTAESAGNVSVGKVWCSYVIGGGSGGALSGNAVLYQARVGDAPVTLTPVQLTSTSYNAVDADWTTVYDPASEFTATDEEVCYTGTGSANVVVQVEAGFVLSNAGSSAEVLARIASGPTGALVDDQPTTLVVPGGFVANAATVSRSLALTADEPCFSVVVGKVLPAGGTTDLDVTYGSLTIWAPGADDSPWESTGSIVRPKSGANDVTIGTGCFDSANSAAPCNVFDVSGGVTINRPDDDGAAFQVVGPRLYGETRDVACEGTAHGSECYRLTAEDSMTMPYDIAPRVLLWDSDVDASWDAAMQDVEIGGAALAGDLVPFQRLEIVLDRVKFLTSAPTYPKIGFLDASGTYLVASLFWWEQWAATNTAATTTTVVGDAANTEVTLSIGDLAVGDNAENVLSCKIILDLPEVDNTTFRGTWDCIMRDGGTVAAKQGLFSRGSFSSEGTIGSGDPTGIVLWTAVSPTDDLDMSTARARIYGVR